MSAARTAQANLAEPGQLAVDPAACVPALLPGLFLSAIHSPQRPATRLTAYAQPRRINDLLGKYVSGSQAMSPLALQGDRTICRGPRRQAMAVAKTDRTMSPSTACLMSAQVSG